MWSSVYDVGTVSSDVVNFTVKQNWNYLHKFLVTISDSLDMRWHSIAYISSFRRHFDLARFVVLVVQTMRALLRYNCVRLSSPFEICAFILRRVSCKSTSSAIHPPMVHVCVKIACLLSAVANLYHVAVDFFSHHGCSQLFTLVPETDFQCL